MSSRNLWLTHPKIKAAVEAQQGAPVKRQPSAYTRLLNAIEYSGNWAMDKVEYDRDSGRISWTFHGVDLIGTNTLLRCHQAKVNKYRQQWKDRTATLILQNQKAVRDWCAAASFPVRYEAIYLTRHKTLMDEDNIIGSIKVVLDELVRHSDIPDDTAEYIRHPLVESRRASIGTLYLALIPMDKPLISTTTLKWLADRPGT